jgi:hypothetical protein
MIVATMAMKVCLTAFLALIVMMFIDNANGTGGTDDTSPLWIAIPGVIAGVTMIAALVVCIIAVIWGL